MLSRKDQATARKLLKRIPSSLGFTDTQALRGFLFLVNCSSELIPPAAWIAYLLGDDDDEEGVVFDDDHDAQTAINLLMKLHNEAVGEVTNHATDYPRDCRILRPAARNAEVDAPFSQWCVGAVRAMEWLDEVWDAFDTDEELDPKALLVSMLCFATPTGLANFADTLRQGGMDYSIEQTAEMALNEFPGARGLLVALTRPELDPDLDLENIPDMDADSALPQELGPGMETTLEPEDGFAPSPGTRGWSSERRKPARSEKIGRNEPCPCGSGKKYKKCCGKPTLH